MRIDPVLCQKILIAVESHADAGSGQFIRISVDGYDEKTIAHHVKHLFDEGLITGDENKFLNTPFPQTLILDISPDGRRHLDQMEPDKPRNKIGF